jgi:hypothetical protein
MHLELHLASNRSRLSSPSRQRCRLPRNRSFASVFAAPAGPSSLSVPTAIAARSTVAKLADNRRGAPNSGRPIGAINRHRRLGWPIAAGNTLTACGAPTRALTVSPRCLRSTQIK